MNYSRLKTLFLTNLLFILIDSRISPLQLRDNDALVQPKPNVNFDNKRPMESNCGLMVHELLKAKNLVFD